MQGTKDIGLRGITVADTKICAVDGERGKLIYRGYDIDELAQYSTFEETVYLLASPMDVLQSVVPMLADFDESQVNTKEEKIRQSISKMV